MSFDAPKLPPCPVQSALCAMRQLRRKRILKEDVYDESTKLHQGSNQNSQATHSLDIQIDTFERAMPYVLAPFSIVLSGRHCLGFFECFGQAKRIASTFLATLALLRPFLELRGGQCP